MHIGPIYDSLVSLTITVIYWMVQFVVQTWPVFLAFALIATLFETKDSER